MTKAKKSPEQRKARELQEATGRPYMECLEQARVLMERREQRRGQEGSG